MPNLPSWLASIQIPDSIPTDNPIDSKSENSNDALYNTDIIPNDAPQLIKDMARNVADILTNIQKIRGDRQSLITTAILTIAQNGYEVEKLGCAFIPMDSPDNGTGNAHTMLHIYHKAISEALHRLVKLLESDGQFNGLGEDMDTLSKRIWDDYHSKTNGGANNA